MDYILSPFSNKNLSRCMEKIRWSYKDKMVMMPICLYNGSMASLYWNSPLVAYLLSVWYILVTSSWPSSRPLVYHNTKHSILQKKCFMINSLAPGRSGFDFKSAIFILVLLIGIFRSYYTEITDLRWMPRDLTDDLTTLVWQQAISWANVYPDVCHQMALLLIGHNELKQSQSKMS